MMHDKTQVESILFAKFSFYESRMGIWVFVDSTLHVLHFAFELQSSSQKCMSRAKKNDSDLVFLSNEQRNVKFPQVSRVLINLY